ncbi:hypothetical protein [Cellulomonas sp. IC4_254]|uniref:hypothetical protein n=1 Tax=Cellulomonas sp. IC4_254 TaxID=2714040 RepID=UPI00142191CF|nr:hypothetical protein [Cellulomonas sp. IC4_254]NHT18210.1 hypothetical protein [Cellulomonas sp. IC4_254]
MSQDPTEHTDGPLPDGDPDDRAEQSTPGSEGDGPEAGYTGTEGTEDAPEGDAPAADGR